MSTENKTEELLFGVRVTMDIFYIYIYTHTHTHTHTLYIYRNCISISIYSSIYIHTHMKLTFVSINTILFNVRAAMGHIVNHYS